MEPTVEGLTFDEWVDFLSQVMPRGQAVDNTRIKFGMPGDDIVDIPEAETDTPQQT